MNPLLPDANNSKYYDYNVYVYAVNYNLLKIVEWQIREKLSQYTSVTYMRLRVSKQIFPGICGVGFQKIPGNIQGIQLKKKG